MADGQVDQAAVTAETPASAPAESQNESATPPATENVVADNTSENRIPKSRLDEVIGQRNRERELRESYEARIRDIEARQSAPQSPNVVDTQVKRLVEKLGLKEEAARELVEAQREISQAQHAQVDQKLQQYELSRWRENLTQKYKDYTKVEPQMARVWESMSPQEQHTAVSSPRGLEMLYHYAKGQNFESDIAKAREEAASQAYANKQLKQAATTLPGASSAKPNGALTRQAINDMDQATYLKRLPEINEALEKGLIK